MTAAALQSPVVLVHVRTARTSGSASGGRAAAP
jgi:hypothetical protein